MVVQTVAFVKAVISRAGGLRECPLGELPPYCYFHFHLLEFLIIKNKPTLCILVENLRETGCH